VKTNPLHTKRPGEVPGRFPFAFIPSGELVAMIGAGKWFSIIDPLTKSLSS
jgi:hypothetical protein